MLLLFAGVQPPGGSLKDPASLPHLSLVFSTALTAYTLTAESGTYAIAGQAAALAYTNPNSSPGPLPHLALLNGLGSTGVQFAADQGAYSISGQDVAFLRGYVMPAEFGAYTHVGQVVTLNQQAAGGGDPAPWPALGLLLKPSTLNRTLTCDPGIYNIVGSDSLSDFEAAAEQGTYTLTGQDVALLRSVILTAEAGEYSIAGQDIQFSVTGTARTMPADTSTYAIAGQDATLTVAYRLNAEQGFYALLGQASNGSVGYAAAYNLIADSGAYTVSGQDAALSSNQYRLPADVGFYSLDGASVQFIAPSSENPGGWFDIDAYRAKTGKKKRKPEPKEEPAEVLAPTPIAREPRRITGTIKLADLMARSPKSAENTSIAELTATQEKKKKADAVAREKARRKRLQEEDDLLLM